MSDSPFPEVAVIGGGPAGLMAAERLALKGVRVTVFETKPSLGRKFLRAGIGGLNLTHAEAYSQFCARYDDKQALLQPMLDAFTPTALREWATQLGIATFEGSSGRVFPVDMKAAPLLRAWVQRLRQLGVRFRLRHRFSGWTESGKLVFHTPEGRLELNPAATVLALGGGSWPQLGSDAAWVPWLEARGVAVTPLESANCGFEVEWSAYLRDRYAGAEIKTVVLSMVDTQGRRLSKQGELVLSDYGVEGSLIYAFSRPLRLAIAAGGCAGFELDLLPGRSRKQVAAAVMHPRGARSMTSHLQSRLGLKGVKVALLREILGPEGFSDPVTLADAVKALPVVVRRTRPLVEAISTAGGVSFDAVDAGLMLKALPGTFVVGEMLDWEAPTGGYLLTACMAQGAWVANSVTDWLALQSAHREINI